MFKPFAFRAMVFRCAAPHRRPFAFIIHYAYANGRVVLDWENDSRRLAFPQTSISEIKSLSVSDVRVSFLLATTFFKPDVHRISNFDPVYSENDSAVLNLIKATQTG